MHAEVIKADSTNKNISERSQTKPIAIKVIADTACQSCMAGSNLLKKLNIKPTELIPVTTKMRSASNMDIKLLGALLLHITGTDLNGMNHSTRQMTYFTDHTVNFYLSRSACADLGIISQNFPTIGDTTETEATQAVLSSPLTQSQPTSSKLAPCGCLKRTLPPEKPSLPFPATEGNRQRLQEFILTTYESSTFNTCPHQPLPHM